MVARDMTRLPFFLPAVLPILFFGAFETAYSATFSLLESQHPFPWARLVILPFQNAPQSPSRSLDKESSSSMANDSVVLTPYGQADASPSLGGHQSGIGFERCIDTDMCVFMITERNNKRQRHLVVELFGTEMPRLRRNCEQEKVLATNAMEVLNDTLSEATQIDVYDHYKVGRKHVARVVADGQDLSELLIGQGLAAPKGHGKVDWCND